MKKRQTFTVSDGDLVLQLEPAEEGGYIVTSVFEPELITEADSLEDAFTMARDAIKAIRASRDKLRRSHKLPACEL
ncbi:MAG: type II toxin-antitoxin system HicB family antitoxin [Planctomycetes bacterium]|nr:type II toxin-antitoxin system HicB family antitoxin [Planctomycetota bacterium]